jgi:hypothetical protein
MRRDLVQLLRLVLVQDVGRGRQEVVRLLDELDRLRAVEEPVSCERVVLDLEEGVLVLLGDVADFPAAVLVPNLVDAAVLRLAAVRRLRPGGARPRRRHRCCGRRGPSAMSAPKSRVGLLACRCAPRRRSTAPWTTSWRSRNRPGSRNASRSRRAPTSCTAWAPPLLRPGSRSPGLSSRPAPRHRSSGWVSSPISASYLTQVTPRPGRSASRVAARIPSSKVS